jgi:hypothetical protein
VVGQRGPQPTEPDGRRTVGCHREAGVDSEAPVGEPERRVVDGAVGELAALPACGVGGLGAVGLGRSLRGQSRQPSGEQGDRGDRGRETADGTDEHRWCLS